MMIDTFLKVRIAHFDMSSMNNSHFGRIWTMLVLLMVYRRWYCNITGNCYIAMTDGRELWQWDGVFRRVDAFDCK